MTYAMVSQEVLPKMLEFGWLLLLLAALEKSP